MMLLDTHVLIHAADDARFKTYFPAVPLKSP